MLYRETVKAPLRPAFIILIVMTAASPTLEAQAPDGPRCVVFTLRDLTNGDDAKDYVSTMTDAVSAAASARGFVVLPEADWRAAASAHALPAESPDSGTAVEIARIAGADFAITGAFAVHDDEVYYSIQCWDASSGALAKGVQATTSFNLALFSAMSLSLSDELLPAVKSSTTITPRVTFTSPDEEMEVYLSGDARIGRIVDGRVTWPVGEVPANTTITVEKRKNGFHTARQTVTLRTDRDIPLSPLSPEHHGATELTATLGALAGLGVAARGYLVPDWLFLRLANTFWLQPPLVFAARVVMHDELSGGLGAYLFLPPDALVRVGVGSGAGVIFTKPTVSGSAFSTDLYLDVACLWVEAGFPGTTLYLRADFKYALGVGECLLAQGWLIESGPAVTVGVLFR
jgi:hypothetical protein